MHQFIGTFVQNAVTDTFIRQIGEREDTIKVMEKYYLQYFEANCEETDS